MKQSDPNYNQALNEIAELLRTANVLCSVEYPGWILLRTSGTKMLAMGWDSEQGHLWQCHVICQGERSFSTWEFDARKMDASTLTLNIAERVKAHKLLYPETYLA